MKKLLPIIILIVLSACAKDEIIIKHHDTVLDTIKVDYMSKIRDRATQTVYDTIRSVYYDTVRNYLNDTLWTNQTITKYDTITTYTTQTKYDTVWTYNTTTKYDTIQVKVNDTVWTYKTITKYDTIKIPINDTIWTYKTVETLYVKVYDTIHVVINPDGTFSNTFWVKYIIDPTTNKKDSVNIKLDQEIQLKSDAVRPGYDFLYWNTKPDGSGKQYNANANYIVKDHVSFYAFWQKRDGLKSSELYEYLSNIEGTPTLDIKIIDLAPDFNAIKTALTKFWKIKVNLDLSDATRTTYFGSLQNCTNIISIEFPPNLIQIPNNGLSGCSGLTSINNLPPSVTSLYINNCLNLNSVSIPNNVKELTIVDCPKINNINIPNSVTKLTLTQLSSLETIEIPNGVTELGSFSNCSSLKEITIPPSVESMNMNFYGCSNLQTVNHSLKECSGVYFHKCTNLKSITIPELRPELYGKLSWSGNAFNECTNLETIVLPNNLTEIGIRDFSNCTGLTSIIIPKGVTNINQYAFYHCTNLTTITIPEGVTNIGDDSFSECTHLTSITIPESVTKIGKYAFLLCSNLTSLTLQSTTPPILGGDLGYGGTIYVPSESVEAYKDADIWKNYANKIVGY